MYKIYSHRVALVTLSWERDGDLNFSPSPLDTLRKRQNEKRMKKNV